MRDCKKYSLSYQNVGLGVGKGWYTSVYSLLQNGQFSFLIKYLCSGALLVTHLNAFIKFISN